ncbi:MAG: hypothetical protein U0R44_03975 [Candidatus Micrarchaeia archaeon]
MKGQAAVEYLMTYGWAILALLIVVGVLFSSGILSPNYLVSEECSFGTNVKCDFSLFNTGGTTKIALRVFNGFPYKIRVTDLALATQDGVQPFTGFDSNVEIESGADHTFNGDLVGPSVPEGSAKRFGGNITYVSCAPELGPACSTSTHVLTGRVTGKIQKS